MKNTKKLSLGKKSVLLVIIMVAVLSVSLGSLAVWVFDGAINVEYERNVTNLAHTVAVSVDGDEIEVLKNQIVDTYESLDTKVGSEMMGTPEFDDYISHFKFLEETPEYQSELEKLQRLSKANGVDIYVVYVYLIKHSDIGKKIQISSTSKMVN